MRSYNTQDMFNHISKQLEVHLKILRFSSYLFFSSTLVEVFGNPRETRTLMLTFEVLERFSLECRKTKTKIITLANHKDHRQYSEPIKTRSNYM